MSSAFFQRWLAICFLSMSFPLVHGQEYLYEIGGMAGGAFYMGDANKTTLFKGMNPSAGVVFRYNANFRIAFKGSLAWATVSGATEGSGNVFPNGAQVSFSRSLVELGGQFEYNFFPYSDKFAYLNTRRLSPYLLVGLGATVSPGGETFAGINLPLGAGVKYKLKNRLNIGCEFSVRKLFGDGLDVMNGSNRLLDNPYGISSSMMKNKDWYSLLLISVTWDFGPRSRQCNSAE
ncbi:MAG: DUF6089 family protein [Tannerella sp.]|nr:DUF6089 family protein [Tannerella sp.]